LIFFALTRTQVGRDGLRREIEQTFNEQFKGRLEIQKLEGNLVNDLFASGVRLYDPAGNLVLAADSAVVRPRWRDLFRQKVSVGRVTLHKPEILLVREQDGSWTLGKSLQQRKAEASGGSPWSFTSAEIRVVDGTVRTSNRGGLPGAIAAGRVFDYTNTQILNLNAVAAVEWGPLSKLVEVTRASAEWPDYKLAIILQGQAVFEGEGIALNEVRLRAGNTDLNFTGLLESLDFTGNRDAEVSLDLRPSRIDFSELRQFFPTLPLSDGLNVSGRVRGPLSDLTLEQLQLERGASRLAASGTVAGLPDRMDFNVDLAPSWITAEDVAALLPATTLPDFQHLGPVSVNGTAQGTLSLSGGTGVGELISSTFNVETTAGRVVGEVEATNIRNPSPHYIASISVSELNTGQLLQREDWNSRINGVIQAEGEGRHRDSLSGRAQINLNPSQFAGRSVDTLSATANVQGHMLEAVVYALQGQGSIQGQGTVDFRSTPSYQVDLALRRFDAGPLLRSDSLWSRIQADVSLSGSGISLDQLTGEVDVRFDSSDIRWGTEQHLIPPNRTVATIIADGAEPRIVLSGDAATVRLDGVRLAPLITLGELWGSAFAQTFQNEFDKPISSALDAPVLSYANAADTTLRTATEQDRLREAARARLVEAELPDGLNFNADLQVHRPDIVAALFPALSMISKDLNGRFAIQADADRISIEGSAGADSLTNRGMNASGLEATLKIQGNLNTPLEQNLVVALDAQADSFRVASQTLFSPSLSFHFTERAGQVSLTTQRSPQAGPFQLTAALDLLPDRNRLTLFNVRVSTGSYEWTNTEDYPIDLYSDAVVIPGLTLESRALGSELVQKIHFHGTLSALPGHTLYADVDNVSLRQLTGLLRMKEPLGGLARGQLALSGSINQPELTGSLEVPVLAYANDIVGRLELNSRFVPGSPDVALDVTLEPVPSADEAARLLVNSEAINGNARALNNALHLGGTFRLPEFRGESADPGSLDLTLDVSRADLFFLEHIFPDILDGVTGYVQGNGTVKGTFRRPLPDLLLQVYEGRFRVPDFNLAYTAEGPARIDVEGIKLDGAMITDGTGGTAHVTGAILFNDYQYFSFDLAGTLDELRIMDVMQSDELPFYGRIWASGDATLTGPIYKAYLRSANATTGAESEVFIPLTESGATIDPGFIVFADSSGKVPDLRQLVQRDNLLSRRPVGERMLLDGLEMDLNIFAPSGTVVHLVIDPLLGDVIDAVGTGRIQLQRTEGEFYTFGTLDVTSGSYLFTAGDVFQRRFQIDGGTIMYDGDPTDAQLNIAASYQTRASSAGLESVLTGGATQDQRSIFIPLNVLLNVTGRVSTPIVDLSLAVDRSNEDAIDYEALEARLNQTDRATEYATSVLLTNTFLLTSDNIESGSERGLNTNQFAFNSLSQLVANQINRYLMQAVPNLDLSFGVMAGERTQDLDITYGVALRLLDERLIIRGEGVYRSEEVATRNQGEFVVEVRLSPTVAVEVFYRREDGILSEAELMNTTGAGLSYQTQFSSWSGIINRLFGWMKRNEPEEAETQDTTAAAGGM
jgi:translocation and assembly module TamB